MSKRVNIKAQPYITCYIPNGCWRNPKFILLKYTYFDGLITLNAAVEHLPPPVVSTPPVPGVPSPTAAVPPRICPPTSRASPRRLVLFGEINSILEEKL